MQLLLALIIIAIIVLFKLGIFKNKYSRRFNNYRRKHNNKNNQDSDQNNDENNRDNDQNYDQNETFEGNEYIGKYQKKYLLTKNEYQEFKKLKQYAAEQNLIICPKVRLLDLLEPRRGEAKQKTLLYKIQSKHVDFVICDQNLYIKAILELDDNSHDQSDRQERDAFIDLILQDVGYKVIRTRSITERTLDGIN